MKHNVTAGTITRTIVLVLALINQVLTATGHNVINIAEEDVNTLISTIFTVTAAIVAWWKNNSFSTSARLADDYMKNLKSQK